MQKEELEIFNDPVIQKMVTIKEYVTHRESILYQLKSNVLLLIVSMEEGGEQVICGKLVEYIRAKKPIFAIVPEGAAKSLIEKYNIGVCAYPENLQAIKNAFLELYRKYKMGTLSISENQQLLQQLDSRNLTKKLTKILNKLYA